MGPPEGTVTVLFTDIERSTMLLEQMGDRGWAEAIDRHDGLIRAALEEHGGFEVKAVGDGFMVAFPSARRALQCAIAIQQRLPSLALMEGGGTPGGVRMGLHTGEAVRRGDD